MTNFTNDAASMKASFPVNSSGAGASGLTASDAELKVNVVNLAVGDNPPIIVYTLTYGGETVIFDDDNLTIVSPDDRVYKSTDGTTVDTFTAFTYPGQSSGAPPYLYVHGGYWTRSQGGTAAINEETIAFAYGLETMDAELPRVGSAGYYADMYGSIAFEGDDNAFDLFGRGSLVADFATGALTLQGGMQLRKPDRFFVDSPYIYSMRLDGSGTISSSQNSFAGTLTMSGVADLSGSFNGRFFGPEAEEAGGAFFAEGPSAAASGYFLGRRDSKIPSKATLGSLTNFTDLSGTLRVQAYGDGAPGTAPVVDDIRSNTASPLISYSPATGTYTVIAQEGFFDYYGDGSLTVGPEQRAAVQDRADFVVYDVSPETSVAIFDGEVAGVKLSYVSFAQIASNRSTPQEGIGGYVALIPFGLRTLPGQMPTTGSATYTGAIFGVANSTGYGTDFVRRLAYTLGGTSNFSVDFSTFSVTGRLNPFGTSIEDGSVLDFGSFDVSGSIGTLQYLVESDPTSSFSGLFYGPNAEEFGGTFTIYTSDQQYELVGATIARQD